ncbi:phage GP46 family protein [uncultured Sutterella sp.]|uniref:phage GP46 family protein n=1 Tax=uncultured Sutterella sp. TaxID=286133 RepID=UPI0026709EA1|nr:phage GP46 family protein [uncultured Sutterella sp.]
MELMINGREADLSDFEADELAQAVLISLFSWRKSNPDDGIDAPDRQGWWGDTYAVVQGDRIGSRLWLLQREKVTAETIRRAEAYAKEGMQWLLDDRMAARIDVTASRDAADRIALNVICYKPSGDRIDAVFTNIWG